MQYQEAFNFLITKLQKGLPSYLSYHNVTHTLEVINAAEEIALAEKISGDELEILKTAALFHDAGFLKQEEGHEAISCDLARKHLPNFDYTTEQIEQICTLIAATHLPQSPSSHLAQILCDADLYYLGTKNYTVHTYNLFKELKKTAVIQTETEWELKQIEFLKKHHFFTATAQKNLLLTKEENLEQLNAKLMQSVSGNNENSATANIKDVFLMLLGAFIASIALKLFLVPNKFFDGGITGISLLVHEFYHFHLGLLILLFNIPFIIAGYFLVGKKFAYYTLVSIILLAIFLQYIPNYAITADKLLICIFGGAFLGIGVGILMRTGAALDGIEVLALYTIKKTSFTMSELIFGINLIIFGIAAFEFGIETALYSVLTYFTATRCIDYVVEGLQEYTSVTIVSAKSEALKFQLVNNLNRAITIYKGERGYLPGNYEISNDCDIIFTVITRFELRKLKNLVAEIDPNAFMYVDTIKEVSGGLIRRRKIH